MKPDGMTPLAYQRLIICRDMVARGANKITVANALGISRGALEGTLNKHCGRSTWPPVIDDAILDGRAPIRVKIEEVAAAKQREIDEGRARADAIRAEREKHLTIEQQKYGLPRRARMIDEMPI